ncbi:MAG: porin family protein [Bacteroidota bacterium]
MRKPLKLLLAMTFIVIITTNSQAQRSGYVATDTSLVISYYLIKKKPEDNARFVYENISGQLKKYTPNDITQYGFKDGTIYVSKEIEENGKPRKVFLERLTTGKLTLYYYAIGKTGTFYLEKDSTEFFKLNKANDQYKQQIIEVTDRISWIEEQLNFVKYDRLSLIKIIKKYNENDNSRFPYIRYGVSAGVSYVSVSVPNNPSSGFNPDLNFSASGTFNIGLFTDIPIEKTDFNVHTGINITKIGLKGTTEGANSTQEAIVNSTSFSIPLLIRYVKPAKNWRPFINGGFNFRYHFENSTRLFETRRSSTRIIVDELTNQTVLNDTMLGFSFGAGVLYNYGPKSIIGGELRFNKHWWDSNQLSKNQFDLLITYSF